MSPVYGRRAAACIHRDVGWTFTLSLSFLPRQFLRVRVCVRTSREFAPRPARPEEFPRVDFRMRVKELGARPKLRVRCTRMTVLGQWIEDDGG